MKTLLRVTASAALSLSAGAVAFGQHYIQTNLQANLPGVAEATDPDLVNAWGLARTSGSVWWVSDNKTGVATLYNGPGTKQSLTVTIPPAVKNEKTPIGSPTGVISNSSKTDFLLASNTPALFIFATLDGTIAAWNPAVALAAGQAPPSTHALTVVRKTDGSIYRGLTSGFINGQPFLYAANFGTGKIDVFDHNFQPVDLSKFHGKDRDDDDRDADDQAPFTDHRLPADFVPFNVQAIGDDIVVTYALHEEGQKVETDGPGNGFVDLYNTSGKLLRRFDHGDFLNSPWGVALAPLDFGRFSHSLLVGQFAGGGDTENSGVIVAYDLATGKFQGLLQDANGKTLAINGVWALSPANVSPANADPDTAPAAQIYFTAGPNKATAGLFGYLNASPAELTEGNAQ
jgi:uncharacterized protein (TIGR03118 family)